MAGKMREMSDITIPSHEVYIDRTTDGFLGKGGQGCVYSGVYKGKKVAVKMLSNQGDFPKQHRISLKREARRLRTACSNPYILNLLGVVMETNNYSLVLEYMHFGTSISFIRTFIVGVPLRVQFAQQIISAMAWLHSLKPPVKHLDMKADNVLINNYFTAKISDFGLSEWKTVTMAYSTQNLREEKGVRCGTLSHIPPEVFMDINKKGSVEEDVYAFGVTLWEIFSGEIPFSNCANRYDMISNAVLNNQRPDLSLLVEDCPKEMKDMIQLSWDQKPQFRPTFEDLQKFIQPIYSSVRDNIPEHIKYIRAQIVHNYQSDPEDHSEYYECTEHFDSVENGLANWNENIQNGFMNGQASPDGSDGTQDITVPPTLSSVSNGRSVQNNPDILEEFPKLSLTPSEPQTDPQTMIPGHSQSRQPVGIPGVAAMQPSVTDDTLTHEVPKALRNIGPAHVPISETRPKQIDNAGVRNNREPASSLSGFVSVRDQQYTPGSKLPHPHGPVAQPVSTVLESETGRRAVEGEDEETSLKGDAVNDFLNDLSLSNPDLLQSLMKSPEALENVLSLVGASGFSSSRPAELAQPVTRTQPRPTNSCAGEVNQALPTMTGSVSVDQLSGQAPNSKKETIFPGTPVQQTTAPDQTADTVRMFPASQVGQPYGASSSERHQSTAYGKPSIGKATAQPNAPAFVTPRVPASQPETARQTAVQNVSPFQEPPQRQTIFGQRVRGQNVQPLRIQLPVQNQLPSSFVQPNVHGSRQAVNNSLFGQQLKTNQGSHAYVQPLSGVPMSGVPVSGVPASGVPVSDVPVSGTPQRTLPQQEKVSQQTAFPQQRPLLQQTVFAQPTQPTPQSTQRQQPAPPALQIQHPTQQQQQTAISNVSASRARSPVETSEEMRSSPTSQRQGQPMPDQNSADPIQEGIRQAQTGSQKDPITIFHRHAGGGSTTITMDADNELPPNLQIGSNNYMVVNGSNSRKPDKKKKQKCRKSQLTTNTDELSMDHIDMVSVEIGKDWKRLCRELDMTEADIEQLQFDYHVSGLYEIMYQGIQRWIQRNGRAATVKRMAEALWEVDRDDIALRLQ